VTLTTGNIMLSPVFPKGVNNGFEILLYEPRIKNTKYMCWRLRVFANSHTSVINGHALHNTKRGCMQSSWSGVSFHSNGTHRRNLFKKSVG
jgi:hypothetical protein